MGSIADIIARGPQPTNYGINTAEQTQAAQLSVQGLQQQLAAHKQQMDQQALINPELLQQAQAATREAKIKADEMQRQVEEATLFQTILGETGGSFDKALLHPKAAGIRGDTKLKMMGMLEAVKKTQAETADKLSVANKNNADTANIYRDDHAQMMLNAQANGNDLPAAIMGLESYKQTHAGDKGALEHVDALEAALKQAALSGGQEAVQKMIATVAGGASADVKAKMAQTEETKQKALGEQQKFQVAQTSRDASILAAAANLGPDALAAAQANLPPERQAPFAGVSTPEDILAIGAGPKEALQHTQEIAKLAEEKKWHQIQQQYEMAKTDAERQRNAISAGHLALANKEFNFKFGSPESRAALTQSVIDNPESFSAIPAELRPGIVIDLTAKGIPVPAPLPATIKTRAVGADMALASIQRVRALMDDPALVNSIGPWAGRLGNLEQSIGATFGGTPEMAQKEQRFRIEMKNLLLNENMAVSGGRSNKAIFDELRKVAGDPTKSRDLIKGSLAGIEANALAVKDEAKRYSFGGAGGAAPSGKSATPGGAAAIPNVGDVVNGWKFKGGDPNDKNNWTK